QYATCMRPALSFGQTGHSMSAPTTWFIFLLQESTAHDLASSLCCSTVRSVLCPAFLAPLRKLRAGQLDHLVTQGNDEPAAFSDGYAAVRVDETEFRMLPANQGLIANDAHVIKPDLRLIVQDQLVLPERFGKTLFQLELLHIYHIQGGVVEAVLTTPGTLGRVHGRVCIAQQRIHVLRIPWADRDAYAWTGVYLIAFQLIERRKSLGKLVHPV